MKQGKLPPDLLAEMLSRVSPRDPQVVVGPRVGEDAAAVAFGDSLLVAGMDPITFATDLIGWYAVQVNANDIAVMGAEPRWFLAALLLPPHFPEQGVRPIFDQLYQAAEALNISLVGGHTEITAAVTVPVIIGCMLGETKEDKLITTSGAQVGDTIILCGVAAVEGTALLARDASETLAAKGLRAEIIARARDFLFDPGISVVGAARAAVATGGVTSMHDPTEGGIATALLEVALASGLGLEVETELIPVLPETKEICRVLGLDALGLIASGALLITTRADAAERVVSALRELKLPAAAIGYICPKESGLTMLVGGKAQPLPRFARDELARFFEEQQK